MHIRDFTGHDYGAIAEIARLARPDHPITAEILIHDDAQREPHLLHGRLVAERDGRVVGVATFMQHEALYVPGEVSVNIGVHPAHRQRGIGAALYEALIDRLRRLSVDTLKARLSADQYPGLNFAMRRGFIEYARRAEARRKLAAFDPSAFPDPDAQMTEQGLVLRPVRELEADPERDRKLYDLKWEIEQDVPFPGQIKRESFEAFSAGFLRAPDFLPDGSFAALDGDRYVGLVFHISASPALLFVELTGTARDYRRRGIAQALKVKSMAWAKQAGFGALMVNNDLSNTGMIAINDKLGFERLPAIIMLERKAPF